MIRHTNLLSSTIWLYRWIRLHWTVRGQSGSFTKDRQAFDVELSKQGVPCRIVYGDWNAFTSWIISLATCQLLDTCKSSRVGEWVEEWVREWVGEEGRHGDGWGKSWGEEEKRGRDGGKEGGRARDQAFKDCIVYSYHSTLFASSPIPAQPHCGLGLSTVPSLLQHFSRLAPTKNRFCQVRTSTLDSTVWVAHLARILARNCQPTAVWQSKE